MQITRTIEIDAPIDFVWGKISNLTDIQRWSATVTESHFHTELQRGQGAGRTCEVKGFGTLVENVLEWKKTKASDCHSKDYRLLSRKQAADGGSKVWVRTEPAPPPLSTCKPDTGPSAR